QPRARRAARGLRAARHQCRADDHPQGRRPAMTRTSVCRLSAALAATLFLPAAARAGVVPSIYALVSTGEIYASSDSARTWHVQSTLAISDGATIFVDAANNGVLQLMTRSGSEYLSSDGAHSWTASGAAPFNDVASVHVRFSDGFPFVLTQHGEVYSHSDDGSWIAVGAFPASDCVALAGANALHPHLALTRHGTAWQSIDDGRDWNAVGSLGYSNCVSVVAYGNVHI